MNILVVEDSITQGLLLKAILQKAGYRVTLARDGDEGLRLLHTLSLPDLVITDIRMPGIDGYELCHRIKSDPKLMQIPVMLLSGLAETEDILLGLEANADSYIIKPFDEEEIVRNVAQLVAVNTEEQAEESASRPPLSVQLHSGEHQIRSSRRQILNFLLSIYDNAIRRNTELTEIQAQLRVINEQLSERTQALEESETRFRSLVQTAPDIIYRIDKEGCFSFVNHAIRKLGYEPSELIGEHFSILIAPHQVDQVSRKKVLPDYKSRSDPPPAPPKLFDEKRTGSRKTMGLEVVLKTKSPGHEKVGRLETMDSSQLVVEVNSSGMYQISTDTPQGQFIGTVGIIRDITDRQRVAEALRMAKDEAVLANQAKSDFLSRMSHELRTPLNAILGFGQLLESDPEEPLSESQADSLEHILEAGRHLLELINEVLDLAKIEAGRAEVNPTRLNPAPILENCLTLTRTEAQKKFVALINRCESEQLPWIQGDKTRFKQVLLNLLSNAVKYNRVGGHVVVSHEETASRMLQITVTDTGQGIAEHLRPQIFEPFSRLNAESTDIEGTGIGLTITRKLIKMMHGEIGFDSEEGVGSRFWVRLPMADINDQEMGEMASVMDEKTVPTPLELPDEQTILYVEDNPSNARLMMRIIRRIPGMTCLQAETAEIGIEKAREALPQAIIMDINLPGMSGYDALKELKNMAETKHIPVIALSANAMPQDVENGLRAGFDKYLVKPLKVNEVLDALGEALDGHNG
ncbi:MAG: response regulator [Magnetococcales bacterium]|nr:response regulator [Magnetococcales bacterium]